MNYNSQAGNINQNIIPTCLIEENQKIVNSIYLNEVDYNNDTAHINRYNYDSTETALLNGIAEQNSKIGGDAVFMARIMLFIDVIDLEMTKSLHLNNNNSNQNKIADYKLYPNPNGGDMQLSYNISGKDNANIIISDLLGKQISSYKLSNSATILNISEKQLENGIYFYQVFINGYKVYSDKIIILK